MIAARTSSRLTTALHVEAAYRRRSQALRQAWTVPIGPRIAWWTTAGFTGFRRVEAGSLRRPPGNSSYCESGQVPRCRRRFARTSTTLYQFAVTSSCLRWPRSMDSRFRGNDDTQLATDIHGLVRIKWYYTALAEEIDRSSISADARIEVLLLTAEGQKMRVAHPTFVRRVPGPCR